MRKESMQKQQQQQQQKKTKTKTKRNNAEQRNANLPLICNLQLCVFRVKWLSFCQNSKLF